MNIGRVFKNTSQTLILLTTLFSGLALADFGSNTSTNIKADLNLAPLHVESVMLSPADNHITVHAGDKLELKIKLNLDATFHAYVDQYRLKLNAPKDFYLSEFQILPTKKFMDPISKKIKIGTEGISVISSWLEIPKSAAAGDYKLELSLVYQACGPDFCLLPKTVPIQKVLTVASAVAIESGSGTNGLSPTHFQSALDKGWLYALFFVFVAGVLTSFTPCIFPMVPITLAVLGTKDLHRSRWKGFVTSLSYVLGIAFTYSMLGIFAAKSGAIFGSYLGHPAVVTAIALVFILMGLSMFGLFEIQLPLSWANKLSGVKIQKNLLGAFFSGLLAGVVASPCVGPVLIGVLTYVANSQNIFTGFILLFTFALGLGQIFLVLGTFQSILQKLPRSGGWMEGVKKVFGVVMFAMAIYYVYPVAKRPVTIFFATLSGGSTNATDTAHAKVAGPQWTPYSDSKLQAAIDNHKPVIIDFNAEWCLACKELELYTFSDPRVIELGKQFVWMTFDATEPSPALEALQKKYSIGGLPFVVVYGPSGKSLPNLHLTGFEKVEPFLKRMNEILAR